MPCSIFKCQDPQIYNKCIHSVSRVNSIGTPLLAAYAPLIPTFSPPSPRPSIAPWGTEPSPSPPLPSETPSFWPSETLIHSVHSKVNLKPISSGLPTTFDKSSSAIFDSLPFSLCVAYCCSVVYLFIYFPFCFIVCTVYVLLSYL